MKIKPYAFQKIGIWRMVNVFKGRSLNADDVGLGKSMQALNASLPYRRKGHIVIVCPNSVKYGWEAEVKKHTDMQSWILEGRKPPTTKPFYVPPIIIINWEILDGWAEWLIANVPITVVIPDEIHYAKTRSALRTKALIRLCKSVPTIFPLSGTPFENCPAELFVTLHLLRPDLFKSFVPFGKRYCDPKYSQWGTTYKGATRIKELNRLLKKHVMVRRKFSEVVKDLPPITRSLVPLKIKMKEYEEAETNIVRWLYKHKPDKAHKASVAKHLVKLNHLLTLVAELKLEEVTKWIDNFLETTDRKITVYGHHREFLEKLHEKYKNTSVLVYGGLGAKKKQLRIDDFVRNKNKRIFFASIMAMGTGVNKLQEVCHDMAVVELVWVGLKLLQVEGRLHRLGQKNKVNVSYLVAKGTVEDILCRAIHRKQKDFNSIIDGDRKRQEFSIFHSVIDTMTTKKKKVT